MKTVEVLGLHEYGNTAAGLKALDAMVKAAPVRVVDVRTINPGKLVILITGDEASVEAALKASVLVSEGFLVDHLYLPNLHPRVMVALEGGARPGDAMRDDWEALGILETSTVAAGISCADLTAKSADVQVVTVRIDDSMGGRASVRLVGAVGEVQYAVDRARTVLEDRGLLLHWTIVPRLSEELYRYVAETGK